MKNLKDTYILIENKKQFTELMLYVEQKEPDYLWISRVRPLKFIPPLPCFIFFPSIPYKQIFFRVNKESMSTMEGFDYFKLIKFNDLFGNYKKLLDKYNL